MTSDPRVPPPEPEPIGEEPERTPDATREAKPTKGRPPTSPIPFTRTAAAWWALIVGSLTLIVLLVFIAQNLDTTTIHFLGWHWNAPVGIAFLVAAICGSLITVMTGAARMVQLRRAAKKNQPPPSH
jgi:uncharacterized integral membrane protein